MLQKKEVILMSTSLNEILLPRNKAVAIACIKGGPLRPQIEGAVRFFQAPNGTLVFAEINGLPPYQPSTNGEAPIGPHGFHLHEFGNCEIGDPQNPFQAAGGHWNPTNQPHGNHAGDFPVLFSNRGYAYMYFYTDKFLPEQIIGNSVIIHQNPDDYRTQPAGAAGKRLACGIIQKALA
jgi:Cu-Zn family superoxide dismutase